MLNKIDLLPQELVDQVCDDIVKRLDWKGRVFKVSGVAKLGLEELGQQAMNYLNHESGDDKLESH